MNPLPSLAACVIAGGLAGSPVWAQPFTPPPSSPSAPAMVAPRLSGNTVGLRTALDAAWQRSVAARDAEGQRRRADADRAVASSVWAAPPSLAISHRDDRLQSNAGRRETEIGVAVPLWLPGQRSARAGTAEVAAAQAKAAEQVARLRLAGEVREAAWHLAALQAEFVEADTQAQSLKRERLAAPS